MIYVRPVAGMEGYCGRSDIYVSVILLGTLNSVRKCFIFIIIKSRLTRVTLVVYGILSINEDIFRKITFLCSEIEFSVDSFEDKI